MAALVDAKSEAARDGGPRPVVLAALLQEAYLRIDEVAELEIARRAPKVAK